jgi:uncharacterized membrane protein YhaH (DUF805 family)
LCSPGVAYLIVLDPFSVLDEENESVGDFQESIRRIPRRTFWAFILAVLLTQAGLFAVSLGLMLIGFRNQWTVGGALVSVGTLALLVTVLIYRWHRAD